MSFNYFQRKDPLTPESNPDVPKQLEQQLGSGLAVPLQRINNKWIVRSGSAKVAQDIFVCLSTPVGRRLLQPDYGSTLPYLIFQPYLPILRTELIMATQGALTAWVPQINVLNVRIDDSEIRNSYLMLIVRYEIKGTGSPQEIKIALATNDQTKIPPGALTIGGQSVFPRD